MKFVVLETEFCCSQHFFPLLFNCHTFEFWRSMSSGSHDTVIWTLNVFQLTCICVVLVFWLTLFWVIQLFQGFYALRKEQSVIKRHVKTTFSYLAICAIGAYIFHPSALLLFAFFGDDKVLSLMVRLLRDLAVFAVAYMCLVRYNLT